MDDHTTLIRLVHDAFDSVKLGDGMSLAEAEAIDSCVSEREMRAVRAQRVEDPDWRDFFDDDLAHAGSALSFLDAPGYLFHLPAFLTWSVRNRDDPQHRQSYVHDALIWSVTQNRCKCLDALTSPQRSAIARYLKFMSEVSAYPEAAEQLDAFWGQYLPL